MLRVHSRHSDDTESEIDTLAREELVKLQRDYRRSEGSRKTLTESSQNDIRKQQAMIMMLEKESEELRKNLSLAGSKQNERRDQMVTRKFEELLSTQAEYDDKVVEEQRKVMELEEHVRTMQKMVSKQRKDMGGALMSEKQHVKMQKQVRVIENRLDKSCVRFNSMLAENAKLRDLIDHLRRERSVFEGLSNRLQKELTEVKRAMGEMIEISTQAHDARDDAQSKKLALKEKTEKEIVQYNMELKELMRVIDHDRKLKEFMSKKDQERTEAHEYIEEMKAKKETEKMNERESTVQSYKEAFERIQEATGIIDIDKLVNKFIEVEDQNFALFNYVNELNNEIELVQEQIQEVQQEIERFKSQNIEMEEKRKAILKELEEQLDETTKMKGTHDTRFSASTRVLEQLKGGVESLFNKAGCDSTAITELLGGHAGVTDNNILQYMGIIEQRCNELLHLQSFIQAKESDNPDAVKNFFTANLPSSGLKPINILPPSTLDDYDSELIADDDSKPLTQDELKNKVMKLISHRETAMPRKIGTAGTVSSTASTSKGSDRRKK
ncbi:coiled-coil domain-containing protein 63-like [Dysidea avara]|uniref:coiled-coil domain-containing protein 63-like n=1 Tax=Dysidea avara TaxID=196820 RepID=UPI00332B113A